MDLSALIFVALAVAWAVYLVPKALKYHEEDSAHRSVDGFSDRMRVVARREAVSRTEAELVPAGRQPGDRAKVVEKVVEQVVEQVEVVETVESIHSAEIRDEEPAAPTPAPRALPPASVTRPAARPAARRAAARRRRVFNLLLLALVVTTALAVGKVAAWAWIAAPATLMVAWLVACRLMVRRERAARAAAAPVRRRRRTLADEVIAAEDAEDDDIDPDADLDADAAPAVRFDDTDEIPVITAEVLDDEPDADGWTPVPVPLPTYVAKAPAGRTVRTIDLDSTGVWSSGRNEIDSQIAREADAQRAQAEQAEADADVERRASGS